MVYFSIISCPNFYFDIELYNNVVLHAICKSSSFMYLQTRTRIIIEGVTWMDACRKFARCIINET